MIDLHSLNTVSSSILCALQIPRPHPLFPDGVNVEQMCGLYGKVSLWVRCVCVKRCFSGRGMLVVKDVAMGEVYQFWIISQRVRCVLPKTWHSGLGGIEVRY